MGTPHWGVFTPPWRLTFWEYILPKWDSPLGSIYSLVVSLIGEYALTNGDYGFPTGEYILLNGVSPLGDA
jgi:hypothetical protein